MKYSKDFSLFFSFFLGEAARRLRPSDAAGREVPRNQYGRIGRLVVKNRRRRKRAEKGVTTAMDKYNSLRRQKKCILWKVKGTATLGARAVVAIMQDRRLVHGSYHRDTRYTRLPFPFNRASNAIIHGDTIRNFSRTNGNL